MRTHARQQARARTHGDASGSTNNFVRAAAESKGGRMHSSKQSRSLASAHAALLNSVAPPRSSEYSTPSQRSHLCACRLLKVVRHRAAV
eukprot:293821-Chlamydomonas_euryale.AAC.1